MKVNVRPYRDRRRPHLKWVVHHPSDDGLKRNRKFFETKRGADDWADERRVELQNLGRAALGLTDDLKREASDCNRRLSPYGWTLTQATDFATAHLEATQRSEKVATIADEFLASMKRAGKSDAYLKDLESRMKAFVATHGSRYAAEITARDVQTWLDGLEGSPVTRNHHRRVASAFFTYCQRHGYAPGNPVKDTHKAKATGGEVEIFTPAQMRVMLSAASGDILASLVLGGFAGLRDSEIDRLSWEHVLWEAEKIDLRAAKTKTAQRRLVEMLPVTLAFLEPFRNASGPVRGPKFDNRIRAFKAMIANPPEAMGKSVHAPIPWQANGLRHSFASYHMAAFKDAGRTALELGHNNSGIVFRHYREVVDEKTAKEWWAIRPPETGKLVKFAGAPKVG